MASELADGVLSTILNRMLLSFLLLVAGLLCFWLFFKSIDFFEKI
jgi:hypothetical protein